MQGFAPADAALLFRQKDPKPFSPVRGPSDPAQKQALRGACSTTPNQDGSETRCAQTVFAKVVGFGAAAQPRPTRDILRGNKKEQLSNQQICHFDQWEKSLPV